MKKGKREWVPVGILCGFLMVLSLAAGFIINILVRKSRPKRELPPVKKLQPKGELPPVKEVRTAKELPPMEELRPAKGLPPMEELPTAKELPPMEELRPAKELSSKEISGIQADKKSKSHKRKKRRKKLWFALCAIILCTAALYFSVGLAQVNGKSMYPNFNHGDIVLYNRLYRSIEYGDVIIFQKDDYSYVKRVFAKPGDRVSIRDGLILVNNSPLILDGVLFLGKTEARDLKEERLLGEGEYFVLGDNRPASQDSRNKEIGMVTEKEITGVCLFGIKRSEPSAKFMYLH